MAEDAVLLIVAEYGLDDVLMEVATIALVLPEVPGACVKGKHIADLGDSVNNEVIGGFTDFIGFEYVL